MATNNLDVDVAILGAGTAGMVAYRAALAHTEKVVVIEGYAYGTTCARVGCMPSKLLIAAADAAHAAREAEGFGIRVGPLQIDGAAVMRRVRSERDRFVGLTREVVESWPAAHRVWGHARFVDARTLQVADHTRITAERVVIATGSRPSVPDGWREKLGDRLLVSDDVFDWHDLPKSVAVVGGGPIGLELAQALHRLGVRVRVYAEDGNLGPLTDPALRAIALSVFAEEMPVWHHASDLQPERDGAGVVVHATVDGARITERFDVLLAATGRKANLEELGLEALGLPRDERGMLRYDRRTGRVGETSIFIAGDAASDRPLLHEAADGGRIAGDNAGRPDEPKQHPRRTPLGVVFTDPQMTVAGASHAELRRAGKPFATGVASFEDQGRSRAMRKNRGAIHVYAERGTGRFLGAEMIGPAAEHIGHLLAWSVQRGDTVAEMLACPIYHPVVEEGMRTALRDLAHTLDQAPEPESECLSCGPGT